MDLEDDGYNRLSRIYISECMTVRQNKIKSDEWNTIRKRRVIAYLPQKKIGKVFGNCE